MRPASTPATRIQGSWVVGIPNNISSVFGIVMRTSASPIRYRPKILTLIAGDRMPLRLRLGRNLYDAEEVAAIFGGPSHAYRSAVAVSGLRRSSQLLSSRVATRDPARSKLGPQPRTGPAGGAFGTAP